ncbi:unnamed protein product [Periconia digitata]|uniref:Uncharacterized protein n=1 Tax=Periconia digitata TaxID=1303443 RepID=A0A9W4XS56_9PLEO|nr:unnamed protein product [Periconia digitata]
MPTLKYTTVTKQSFETILLRYPLLVPEKLHDLDQLRYQSIPATAAKRKAAQHEDAEEAYLNKDEVEKLVEWKLSHGTFRPKLLQLVLSNESTAIETVTRDGFRAIFPHSQQNAKQDREKRDASLASAIKYLTSLRGIGPATASLLLSVYAPDTIPFFSDELFRWVMWNEADSGGQGSKWKRRIKYNGKEYAELAKRVGDVISRLKVSAVDCERVAWVLGKEGADVDVDADFGGGESVDQANANKAEEQSRSETRKEGNRGDVAAVKEMRAIETKENVKRKVVNDDSQPVEGLRRSARRKRVT